MGLTDFHAHLAPTREAKERLLKSMERLGITQTVVVAGGLVRPEELAGQIALGGGTIVSVPNETVRRLCDEAADEGVTLFPFFFANPHEAVDEYVRTGKHFFGLKLGPAVHGIALTDSRTIRYLEVALNHQHPVYLHCLSRPGFDIEALIEIATQFPKLLFVLGHAGIGNCDFHAVSRIAPFQKIYFETSGGFSSVVKFAIEKLGMERVVFGSEYPLQDPSLELLKAHVTGMDYQALHTNACRLLGLEQAHA